MLNEGIAESLGCELRDGALTVGPVRPPDAYRQASASIEAKIILAGICRSDLKEITGSRYGMRTFGHEVIAEITRSSDSLALDVGMRFVLDPHIRVERTSGFATDLLLWGSPEEVKQAVRPIDSSIPPDLAVFAEPLACAISCIQTAQTLSAHEAHNVLVYGAGQYGAILALLLIREGYEVTITNRSEGRLRWIADKIETEELPITATKFEDLEHASFDLVIDASAQVDPSVYPLLADLLSTRGQLHVFAGTRPQHSTALGVDLDDVRRNSKATTVNSRAILVTGSHGAGPEHFRQAIELLENPGSPVELQFLIEQRINLNELPSALRELTKQAGYGKALVDPRSPGDGKHVELARTEDRFAVRPIERECSGALFEPLIVGLCGTDLQMISGERSAETAVLGHEVVGRILESKVPNLHPGQVVIANPVRASDPNFVLGHSVPGALSERLSIDPGWLEEHALIPYQGPLELGSLVEPAACVHHGIRATQLDSGPRRRVAIVGDGALSAIAALMVEAQGHRVEVLVKAQHRIAPIHDVVAYRGIPVSVSNPISSEHHRAFDVILNCTTRRAAPSVLRLAALLLKPGGYLDMIAGVEADAASRYPLLGNVLDVRAANVCGQEHSERIAVTLDGNAILVTGHRGAGLKDFDAAQSVVVQYPELFRKVIGQTLQLTEAAALLERWARYGRQPTEPRGQKTVVLMPALDAVDATAARWRPQFQVREAPRR